MSKTENNFWGRRYIPAMILILTVLVFGAFGFSVRTVSSSSKFVLTDRYFGDVPIVSEPEYLKGSSQVKEEIGGDEEDGLTIHVSQWLNFMSNNSRLWPSRGFLPLEVEVENEGNRTRSLDFFFSEAHNFGANYNREYFFPMEVPPRGVKRYFFYWPLSDIPEEDVFMRCIVSDKETGKKLANRGYARACMSSSFKLMGVSSFLYDRLALNSLEEDSLVIARFDPLSLSPDWRVYSSMDGFLISGKEWAKLSFLHRQALLDWVNTGGILFINRPKGGNVPSMGEYGWGHIFSLDQEWMDTAQKGNLYKTVFGGVDVEKTSKWSSPEEWTVNWEKVNKPSNNPMEICTHGVSAKPEEKCDRELETFSGRIRYWFPEKWLWGVLLCALLIGPVNYFVMTLCGRKKYLLWTTPLLILMGTVGIVYMIRTDSERNGLGKRFVLVQLSPDSPKAYVSQSQIVYVAPYADANLSVDEETLLSGVDFVDLMSIEKGWCPKERYIREKEGIRNFFEARILQHKHIARYVSLSGAVSLVSRQADNPVVMSSLPVTLKQLEYSDGQGRIWIAEELPPHVPVMLRKKEIRKELSEVAANRKGGKLSPGYFVAWGEPGCGIPLSVLEGIRWSDKILYRGRIKEKEERE